MNPAFPIPMIPCDNSGGYTEVRYSGMEICDYFAGQALVGLLASSRIHEISAEEMDAAVAATAQLAFRLGRAMVNEGACQP